MKRGARDTVSHVGDDLRERLLASYADLGEAMVIQNVLEAEGIASRVEDLGHVPDHVFGIAGALKRSVGLYVLEVDVDRAGALLATLGAPENAVDEEALRAQAEAAVLRAEESPAPESPAWELRRQAPSPERAAAAAATRPRRAGARSAGPPWRIAAAVAVAAGALAFLRTCA